jgi:Ca2+-binding EF-hand superfamily protein
MKKYAQRKQENQILVSILFCSTNTTKPRKCYFFLGISYFQTLRHRFEFLDLDKNGKLGAAELRHIFVGMDELVSDEEIDMMIRMLDTNSDGKVNVDEFIAMVTHPDPSRDEFFPGRNLTTNENDEVEEVGASMVTRADIEQREIKRQLLSMLVSQKSTNGSTKPYGRQRLLKVARDIISLRDYHVPSSSAHWRVGDMSELARVFSLDANSQQTQDLFRMFAINPTATINNNDDQDKKNESKNFVDLRQIIMGMTNFIPSLTSEDKCQLAFDLYDEKKSRFLLIDEIEQLLVGTYLYPRSGKVVLQKAKIIMSSADAHPAGGIGFEELLQVATKFPNLVFPSGAFGPLK